MSTKTHTLRLSTGDLSIITTALLNLQAAIVDAGLDERRSYFNQIEDLRDRVRDAR